MMGLYVHMSWDLGGEGEHFYDTTLHIWDRICVL